MKRAVVKLFNRLGVEVRRFRPDDIESAMVRLQPDGPVRGRMLLSYRVEWFLKKEGEAVLSSHTNFWESQQIAHTFLDLGYGVDVIDFRNRTFVPETRYDVFVGARTNFDRLSGLLGPDCLKIVHLDTAHWVYNNHASFERSLNVQRRKGKTVTIESQRIVESNLAIENADYATLLGNRFTFNTYAYAGKSVSPIPITTCFVYKSPEEKDFNACRKNFLWFGSGGLIHKGLDLVLDAFSDMPDYHLYVCGPVEDEKRFVEVYRKELFETPNIHTVGWVDPGSDVFRDLANKCLALVYPSCAEGQSGSVVNCLHAGLIPIISRESGVDINNFGVILTDCSVDVIRDAVMNVSGQSADALKQMSRSAWEYARRNHTRERFAEEYKKVINAIMAESRLGRFGERNSLTY